ncbi:MAG: class I SAM-dependent methyltransferase [bacterium]|nr:class I SAM-dependent methyltransferase [bacterium]
MTTLDTILAKLEAIEKNQHTLLLEQKSLYRQIEALFALYHQLDFRAPLLGLRGWAASPDMLAILASRITDHRPQTILEAGGGNSTLISAYCLQQLGGGHVYALDHDPHFAKITQQQVLTHRLTDYATVIYAPLIEYIIGDKTWRWYDVKYLPADLTIDLLLVDGPPQYNQPIPLMRYPALPLLNAYLTSGAVIIMDDADRDDETRIATGWQAEFPLRLVRDYPQAYADSEKGVKVFLWDVGES